MINFIKDAVQAVSGIKTFLFNTDYRNNFDLQNVEFPCCVLTPIMSKKYDLTNIIRESAELQLSVVDLAPYEYTGDDLYAINKRCSDLALQVIANLQVKSKLDKELTFEFILPSGDELISGVMCNLQCTMKQGSCIGAPSYVEIVVQPIKKESITSNGKHVITPSSGFNAMREVEVDVQIGDITLEEKIVDITSNGEVEILPTSADAMTKVTANVQVPPPPLEEKQVTITRNGTTEILPTSEYGLSKVEVLTDIPLESKQITITENGTTTIEASEGFEGLSSVEVTTDIQGINFSDIYTAERTSELNQFYNDGIAYAKQIKIDNTTHFENNGSLIFLPDGVDFSQRTTMLKAFSNCANFMYLPNEINTSDKNKTMYATFSRCYSLKNMPRKMDTSGVTSFYNTWTYCYNVENMPDVLNTDNATTFVLAWASCIKLKKITLTSIKKLASGGMNNAFASCEALEELHFTEWMKYSITLNSSALISPESIHYIIQNAIDVADGATARTLTLHAVAKTNWQNSEYYEQDLAVLEQKGITIA